MIEINGDKFVVTGGAGFIGSHIAEELAKQHKQVQVLDINYIDRKYNFDAKYVTDFDRSVISHHLLFDADTDVVFHEACSKCTVCRDDPYNDLMVNAWGAFSVFEATSAIGAKVVHASTGSVYGDCSAQVEKNQYAPKSFYGVSKLAGEQYLRAFHEYDGLRYVGLRYFHVYGPRQYAGPSGGVIAIFITKMLKGEPIQIFGDGEQVRSFTYVKDVVAANFIAANSKGMEGRYFNVASGARISLNQMISTLEDVMKVNARRQYFPVRKGDIRDFNVSNEKVMPILSLHGMSNWAAFEDGLKETVDWYRKDFYGNS